MLTKQDYMKTGEQIDCPAPLPEDPATALLTEMLAPAPYKVPEKKATGTRKGLRREVAPDASPEGDEAHSSHEGEEKKRKGPPHPGRPKGPRRWPRGAEKVSGAGP